METQPAPSMPSSESIKELVKEVESGKRTAMITELNVNGLKSDHPHNSGVSILFVILSMMAALKILLSATTADVFWTTILVFSEAKLSIVERTRLYSRRLGCCDANLFSKMQKIPGYSKMPKLCALNLDCKVMDEAV